MRSLFFHTRDASCPMILESKIRLWMRAWSPVITHTFRNTVTRITLYIDVQTSPLTLVRFRRDVYYQSQKVLQKVCVVVREMQTFAVFSANKGKILKICLEKETQNCWGWFCVHLGARNTCPEDSKELGSNDCISVTQRQKKRKAITWFTAMCFLIWSCLFTYTEAAASRHWGRPECSIHCRAVIPNPDFRWCRHNINRDDDFSMIFSQISFKHCWLTCNLCH